MFVKTETGEKYLPYIWDVKLNKKHFNLSLIGASLCTIMFISLIPVYTLFGESKYGFVMWILILLPQLMYWWWTVGVAYARLIVSQDLHHKGHFWQKEGDKNEVED